MPSRNNKSRGLLAKNCGVKDKGRLANPKPLRIIPATASPGVISSWLSGTKRVSIISIRHISLMTSAMSPKWSKRSTVTNAIVAPPLCPIGSSRYSEEDKWFFYFAHLLNVGYYKTYPTFDGLATQFDMARSQANENRHKLSPILYDTLVHLERMP